MKIEDIAKLANVSKSAVSLALNGKAGVSQETRDKIIKIANEHGYITRPIIKSEHFQKQDSKFLRFVACTNDHFVTEQYESLPFFTELIGDINKQMATLGYSLVVSSINGSNLEKELLQLEKNQKSAGILLLGTNLNPQQIKIIADIQPNLVVLDTCFETLDINFVVMNNFFGAYQAGEYLVNLGHKQIGYVASKTRIYNFEMRKKGFLQALSKHQITIAKENFFSISPTLIAAQEAFKQTITNRTHPLPTAVFCEADYMAISVIKSLTKLGIKVPEDISVMGFDNIFESQVITPELTTIHVKKDKLAILAVNQLIEGINQEKLDTIKLFVDTEIIIRKSCTQLNNE